MIPLGESEGRVDIDFRTKERAKEQARVAGFKLERLRLNRMIAEEEKRRQEIGKRLQLEIRRLRVLRRTQ